MIPFIEKWNKKKEKEKGIEANVRESPEPKEGKHIK